MSQTDLAAQFGEKQIFVSRVELRQRRLDVWEFVKMCRALGLDPAEVLKSV